MIEEDLTPHNDYFFSRPFITVMEEVMKIIGSEHKPKEAFLQAGELKPYLADFTVHLYDLGFSFLTIKGYRDSICHFGTWMEMKQITVASLDESVVLAFAKHNCNCPGGRKNKRLSQKYIARVYRFFHFLEQRRLLTLQTPVQGRLYSANVIAFGEWLLHQRGLSKHSIKRYCQFVTNLLLSLGEDFSSYDAPTVRDAIGNIADRYCRATLQGYATALRAFLRYLVFQGLCQAGLEHTVPRLPNWRLAVLPRYLMAEDVERILATCDRESPKGLRNRAILLLLARLGLRAGDIMNLCLVDIRWNESAIRLRGKSRRDVLLPLPQDVGDALLEYVEKGRPTLAIPQAFLCLQAPYRSLATSSTVSSIVRAAIEKAGIVNPPSYGANLMRHSAATALLRNGATLETVSTVLRHRSMNTTAHYAKIHLPMLEQIVQPWPGGTSC
jgi:site-specific recombinase XerD